MHGQVRTFTAATDHGQAYLVPVPAEQSLIDEQILAGEDRAQADQDWTLRTTDLLAGFTLSVALAGMGGSIGIEIPENLPAGSFDRHAMGTAARVGLVARPRTGVTLPSEGPDGGRR